MRWLIRNKSGLEPDITRSYVGRKDDLNLEFISIRGQIKKNTKFRLA